MTKFTEKHADLVVDYLKGVDVDGADLDEAVHLAKDAEAARINGREPVAQLCYLLGGCGLEQAEDELYRFLVDRRVDERLARLRLA